MKLTIERKRWLRGDDGEKSRLLTHGGTMCCLGFFARACGYSEEEILDVSTPLGTTEARWPAWIFRAEDNGHSQDVFRLISVNDSSVTSEAERERVIAATFAKHGVEVEFVD